MILHRDNVVQCDIQLNYNCNYLLSSHSADLLPRSSKQTDLQMMIVELHNGIQLKGKQYSLTRALNSKETGDTVIYGLRKSNDITATSLES